VVRVWAISGLLVALVVAGILVFRDGPSPKPDPAPQGRPAVPSPLTEQEVRTYIAVWPQLNRIMADVVLKMDPGRGGVNEEEMGRQAQAATEVVLVDHHLTHETWILLRRRVEHAVDVVRWREEGTERNTRLDAQIQQKESLLRLAKEESRAALEADIEALKAQRADLGPVLSQHDVALVKSFWKDLDRIVPPRGSPRKKR
jgi:hypothetical protein